MSEYLPVALTLGRQSFVVISKLRKNARTSVCTAIWFIYFSLTGLILFSLSTCLYKSSLL